MAHLSPPDFAGGDGERGEALHGQNVVHQQGPGGGACEDGGAVVALGRGDFLQARAVLASSSPLTMTVMVVTKTSRAAKLVRRRCELAVVAERGEDGLDQAAQASGVGVGLLVWAQARGGLSCFASMNAIRGVAVRRVTRWR
jgi:hypothetical protein